MKYDYGDAYVRHPCAEGVVVFNDGSRLMTHDILDPLPDFMREADIIFTDSPWSMGNLRAFYTKAEQVAGALRFEQFYRRLFECVAEIAPRVCYLEIGKEHLADYIIEMRKMYKHVTFYNSTYYHKADNHCYVVRGSKQAAKPSLDGMDEEDMISWVCANEQYTVIGDLCMGRGLVARAAARAGKRFCGTELNHKRLSVAIERVLSDGLSSYVVTSREVTV